VTIIPYFLRNNESNQVKFCLQRNRSGDGSPHIFPQRLASIDIMNQNPVEDIKNNAV
jgi:hypothetical protein